MKNQIKISKENALLITSMEQLLTQIDSIKEKITDQEYKDMMDSLKILHDKEDDEYKYELVIARIHNHNKDVSHEPIEYRIEKMVLIPKNSFRPYKAKELIEKTEEEGGILNHPMPLQVNMATSEVFFADDSPNAIFTADADEEQRDFVASYQEFTLLAVREIKD